MAYKKQWNEMQSAIWCGSRYSGV